MAFGQAVRSGQALPVTSWPTFCCSGRDIATFSAFLHTPHLSLFLSVCTTSGTLPCRSGPSVTLTLWFFLSMAPVTVYLAAQVNIPNVLHVRCCPSHQQVWPSADSGLHGLVPLSQNRLGFRSRLLH